VEYYALKPPTGRPSWDYFLLYSASLVKRRYKGTFYFPGRTVLPVFIFNKKPDLDAFEKISRNDLSRSYKMICVKCGLCCVRNSGAFMFEHEYRKIVDQEGYPAVFPSKIFSIYKFGEVKVYFLGTERFGRCFFYDSSRGCTLRPAFKPIICIIQFCTLFAKKNGKIFLKVAVKNREGGASPVYKPVNHIEYNRIVEFLRAKVKKFTYRYR